LLAGIQAIRPRIKEYTRIYCTNSPYSHIRIFARIRDTDRRIHRSGKSDLDSYPIRSISMIRPYPADPCICLSMVMPVQSKPISRKRAGSGLAQRASRKKKRQNSPSPEVEEIIEKEVTELSGTEEPEEDADAQLGDAFNLVRCVSTY
jgi:hypothetical protein